MEYDQFTSEQWQYWGGFFGDVLKPSVDVKVVQPTAKARNPRVRTYYKPRLSVFDRRREYLEHIESNFGGKVREQSKTKEVVTYPSGFKPNNGYLWRLADAPSILAVLSGLQPHLIAQQESARIMLDFLSAKEERSSEYCGSNEQMAQMAELREAEESEFVKEFTEAKKNRVEIKSPLTAPNYSGILDATGAISITRAERTRGGIEYGARVEFRSGNVILLSEIAEQFNIDAGIKRAQRGQGVSEKRFVLSTSKKESVRQLLETTFPHLVLLKAQADLALGFLNLQQKSDQTDELEKVLKTHSTPTINLAQLIREGFYSQMYSLNHE